ncbi:MAG: 50S ribosomal protein L30 [Prevotellaceae bacterium]|nr:50S ribosomal protein L30 [Candidatus Colivivens caballi]MCQ2131729.1 50S ribosomal protein L30 [Bacteroidaceae bacterium]
MATIKIKQIKSRANRPIDQKRTLDSLGLTKLGRVVEHEDTPSVRGMINKVSHLVQVID